jgi:hypothetical protein
MGFDMFDFVFQSGPNYKVVVHDHNISKAIVPFLIISNL